MPESLEALAALILGMPADSPCEGKIEVAKRLGSLFVQAGETPDEKTALDALTRCIQHDRSPGVVQACVQALSRAACPDAVGVLVDVALATHIAIYDSPAPQAEEFARTNASDMLRRSAIQALGNLGNPAAIVPLMSLLNNKAEHYRLRLAAAESLGKLGDEHAVGSLVEIITDEREKSLYLKESAAKALGMLGDIRALEPMIDVLESKQSLLDKFRFLKEHIIEAIRRIGTPSPKVTVSLLRALDDDAPSIRLAAVEALADLGDRSCLAPLQICLHDRHQDVAFAAVAAIYRIGGEEAVRELLASEAISAVIRDELESYIP